MRNYVILKRPVLYLFIFCLLSITVEHSLCVSSHFVSQNVRKTFNSCFQLHYLRKGGWMLPHMNSNSLAKNSSTLGQTTVSMLHNVGAFMTVMELKNPSLNLISDLLFPIPVPISCFHFICSVGQMEKIQNDSSR